MIPSVQEPSIPATATGPSPTDIAAEAAKDARNFLADYMAATDRQWLVPVAATLGIFLLCGLCRRLGRAA